MATGDKVKITIAAVSLKLTATCSACGRMFRFETTDPADLGHSLPTRCEECRTPRAIVVPKRAGKTRGKR